MEIDPAASSWRDAYKLLVGAVVPRPIAWVSTLSADGIPNLAPFSFFTAICARPMTVCFAPMVRGTDGGKKDTLRNIEATGEFVLNVVTAATLTAMNETSGEYSPEVNEFAVAGLTAVPGVAVRPSRVAEAPVHLECRLHHVLTLGTEPGGGWLVVGQVVHVHVQDPLWNGGRIDTMALQPVSRLAGDFYTVVRDQVHVPRPGQ